MVLVIVVELVDDEVLNVVKLSSFNVVDEEIEALIINWNQV